MKKYIQPTIKFNRVRETNIIVTSTPGIVDSNEANPTDPALGPQRGKDWENW